MIMSKQDRLRQTCSCSCTKQTCLCTIIHSHKSRVANRNWRAGSGTCFSMLFQLAKVVSPTSLTSSPGSSTYLRQTFPAYKPRAALKPDPPHPRAREAASGPRGDSRAQVTALIPPPSRLQEPLPAANKMRAGDGALQRLPVTTATSPMGADGGFKFSPPKFRVDLLSNQASSPWFIAIQHSGWFICRM